MNKILSDWDASLSEAQHQKLDVSLTRRQFVTRSLKTVTAFSLLPTLISLAACSRDPAADQQSLLTQAPWYIFAAVQQQLFPADGNGPSAIDLNATLYLKFMLDAQDMAADDRTFIYSGIDWLNDLAQKTFQRSFIQCDNPEQDRLLHMIANSRSGERWLSFLLLYIFEALLTDPVYGGNPNGIGWQWLEHQPGFPHPPKDKIYTELLLLK